MGNTYSMVRYSAFSETSAHSKFVNDVQNYINNFTSEEDKTIGDKIDRFTNGVESLDIYLTNDYNMRIHNTDIFKEIMDNLYTTIGNIIKKLDTIDFWMRDWINGSYTSRPVSELLLKGLYNILVEWNTIIPIDMSVFSIILSTYTRLHIVALTYIQSLPGEISDDDSDDTNYSHINTGFPASINIGFNVFVEDNDECEHMRIIIETAAVTIHDLYKGYSKLINREISMDELFMLFMDFPSRIQYQVIIAMGNIRMDMINAISTNTDDNINKVIYKLLIDGRRSAKRYAERLSLDTAIWEIEMTEFTNKLITTIVCKTYNNYIDGKLFTNVVLTSMLKTKNYNTFRLIKDNFSGNLHMAIRELINPSVKLLTYYKWFIIECPTTDISYIIGRNSSYKNAKYINVNDRSLSTCMLINTIEADM